MTAPAVTSAPYRVRLAAIAAIVLSLDVASKIAAENLLEGFPVSLGPLLSLRLVRNTGIAFGLGTSIPSWALLGLTTAIVAVLARAAWQGKLAGAVPSGLILGGAAANVADRAIGGSVVDMIDLGWWPTFNLADSFIVFGTLIILLGARGRKSASRRLPREAATGN